MQRTHKQVNDTALRTAQAKFTAHSRESERENSIHDSPAQTAQRMKLQSLFGNALQRQETEDDLKTAQRVEDKDELQKKSAPTQMKNEDDGKTSQLKMDPTQRKDDDEIQAKRNYQIVQRATNEEELKQAKFANQTTQLKDAPTVKPNNTGLPDNLKSGIENLSGMSMDNVKVHYNSSQPAQLNALAYAQGTDIHVAPGQEQHLPHEAWHMVQQAQGRVKPTMQMKEGVLVNDDKSLEHEADVMGARADSMGMTQARKSSESGFGGPHLGQLAAVQLKKATKPTILSAQQQLIDDIGSRVKQNVLSGKSTVPERSDAIWDEAVKVFDDNKVKGAGYAKKVSDAVSNYKNTVVPMGGGKSPKESLVENNQGKRSGYDTTFSSNYANAPVETLGTDHYRVNTKGYDTVKPTVDQGEYEGDYSNEINLGDGSIKAAWNMAAFVDNNDWSPTVLDEALKAGKGLNNSEILWQQYKLAAEEKHKAALDKDTQVQAELKNISTIKRDTIINHETLVTGYMAYDDGKKWNSDQDWTPGTEEFNAVLGTPNAKSSAFFLMDHMDQLEKTFDKITGTSSHGLDIKFKAI